MQLQIDCIPCILKMTISSLRKLNLSESAIHRLYDDILTIPSLMGKDWRQTSPDIIELIMDKTYKTLGDTDPFRDIKIKLNERVQELIPFAKKLIQHSSDPFYTAAKLAIIGNAMDFMMPSGNAATRSMIEKRLKMELIYKDYSRFRKQLAETKKILYFTDNCGEIVLDKLFIQILKQHYDVEVTIVTRHYPALNDATLREARDVGLEQVATLTDSGIKGPLPGTQINRCSKRVKNLIKDTDLIISKGGGNFDSLEEELQFLKTKITFMLLSKCHPINSYFNVKLNQPIIANFH